MHYHAGPRSVAQKPDREQNPCEPAAARLFSRRRMEAWWDLFLKHHSWEGSFYCWLDEQAEQKEEGEGRLP
jgi:hypothetical protein